MDADNKKARIAIELHHPDPFLRSRYYAQLEQVRSLLHRETGEQWQWQSSITDEDGKEVSRIGICLAGVNIFNRNDWPAIISFLKPRILALDKFWNLVKEGFE
jgi:hypothetical protein